MTISKKSTILIAMVYGLLEKKMEVRSGEIPLTKRMRKGFFGAIGGVDLLHETRFVGVDWVEEPSLSKNPFRLVVNMEKTNRATGNHEEASVGTLSLADRAEAQALATNMSYSQSLARANRTLEVVEDIHLKAGLVAAGGVAMASVVFAASSQAT